MSMQEQGSNVSRTSNDKIGENSNKQNDAQKDGSQEVVKIARVPSPNEADTVLIESPTIDLSNTYGQYQGAERNSEAYKNTDTDSSVGVCKIGCDVIL